MRPAFLGRPFFDILSSPSHHLHSLNRHHRFHSILALSDPAYLSCPCSPLQSSCLLSTISCSPCRRPQPRPFIGNLHRQPCPPLESHCCMAFGDASIRSHSSRPLHPFQFVSCCLSHRSTGFIPFHLSLLCCSARLLLPILFPLPALRTPAVFDSSRLDPTLNWFFDRCPCITGIDCSCPYLDHSAQLAWLRSVLSLIRFLSSHCHLSCFLLFITLPADFDCGTKLSALAQRLCPDPWRLHMGPTSSALYDNAVHSHRWICMGLHQIGLFPPPIPSFPPPSLLSPSLGDHVFADFNQVSDDCLLTSD